LPWALRLKTLTLWAMLFALCGFNEVVKVVRTSYNRTNPREMNNREELT
jgi:hypothetical protein